MNAPTPGPWSVFKPRGEGRELLIAQTEGDRAVATVHHTVPATEAVANAHLFSASLEMLATLRLARGVLAAALRAACPDMFETDADIDAHLAIKDIDNAIAKATGKPA